MTAILSIDQGTSGTKAIVVGSDGAVLALAEEPVRPTYLAGGGVEQDPAALLSSVLSAGRRAVADAGVPLAGVALANQGETVLNWDPATGRPLSPAVVWQDRRAEALCAEIAGDADWIAERTGLVVDPYFSAPKLAWLRRNGFRTGVVTTTDSWLVHRLCGAFVTDASTASRSLLLDLDRRCWDDELLAAFGLSGEPLPSIVGSDEIVGETTAFGPAVPVTGLVVDQQAALFAQGCTTPGEAKCTFGTGAFLLATVGPEAVRSAAGLTVSVAWQTSRASDYCVDGQVYTAGSAVRWLQDAGLLRSAADLDVSCAADSAGVLCVPAMAGLAAPWWRPDATASFTGISLASGAGELIRAVVEGIAAQVAELATQTAADLGRPLRSLRVDGGLTRSAVLMQAVADLLQTPVLVYPSPHATALGAAGLARLGLDRTLALEDAVPDWTPAASYEPLWSAERAADFRARWREALLRNNPSALKEGEKR